MTIGQRFAIFVCMSDYHLTMLIIGIIIFICVAIIVGLYAYEYCRAKRAEKKHIHNICYPYRIVCLGDKSYALQHYVVPCKRASTAYWSTMKKYEWLPDAPKKSRYKMLEASFKKSLEGDWRGNPPVEADFRKLFDEMAPKLSEIKFNDCFVDISVMRQWLDFNLVCPDELVITACRVVGQEDDSVMYSVSHHKITLMIHHNQTVDSLVDAANEAIKLVGGN